MKGFAIRILIIIGGVAIIGLAGVQFYLLKSAFNNRLEQFEHSAQVALFQVVHRLNNSDYTQKPQASPVIKKTSGYYIVEINRQFDCEVLEFFIISEFERANIKFDFEYAIYDCHSDKMIYGNYVTFKDKGYKSKKPSEFPIHQNITYYFAVYFPTIKTDLYGSLKLWGVFAVIFVIVLGFVVYAIWLVMGQKRVSEMQRNFITTVTHEFRTPIAASNVAIEYLQDTKLVNSDKRIANYVGLIHQQNTRLTGLIERLLNLAKLQSNTRVVEYERFNLIDVIEDVIQVHQSKNKQVSFQKKYETQQVQIVSDKFHAVNVLHVIIDNAIKYSQETPVIKVGVFKINKGWSLTICDNGIGIPREYREKVFKQFYRIPTGNVHNVKGFGIGLYYVKLIAGKMNWKTKITDAENKGTCFSFKIPNGQKLSGKIP